MKYLGMYSGKLYDDKKDMVECGIWVGDERENDEEYLNSLREKNKIECKDCYGCPMSFNNHIKY